MTDHIPRLTLTGLYFNRNLILLIDLKV